MQLHTESAKSGRSSHYLGRATNRAAKSRKSHKEQAAKKKRASLLKQANAKVRAGQNTYLGKVLFALCKTVDSPVALRVWLAYKYQSYDDMRRSVDPLDYCNVADFQADYIVTELLSKLPLGKGTDEALTEAALQRFTTAESICHETNVLLEAYSNGKAMPVNRVVHEVFDLAQRKIGKLLERYNPYDGFDNCKWGPGSTASLASDSSSRTKKVLEDRLSVTADAVPLLRAVLPLDPFWLEARGFPCDGPTTPLNLESHYVVNQFSKLSFVAKNAKTHRIIGAEPTANVFMQLGVASVLRRALREVGVDLDDQSINQRGSFRASMSGTHATIDESMASDLVSSGLVALLLPPNWYHVLSQLRTPYYRFATLPAYKGEFEKFSSMGNGYTFELESLIFWALAQASIEVSGARGRAKVYGDDIIIPTKSVPLLYDVFSFTGFLVNHEKSHTMGYFRESCGVHHFNGYDVTPAYQRERLTTVAEFIALHNRVYRLNERLQGIRHSNAVSLQRAPWFEPARRPLRPTRTWAFDLSPVVRTIRRLLDSVLEPFKLSFVQPEWLDGDSGVLVTAKEMRAHLEVPCGPGINPVYRCLRAAPAIHEADVVALWSLAMRFGPNSEMPYGMEGVRPKILHHRISWCQYYC